MARDEAYYMGIGLDEGTARYFAAGRPRLVSVRPERERSLLVAFEDGEARRFDVAPLIKDGTVFSFLADGDAFSRAYIDEDGSIAWDRDPAVDSRAVWSNKVDLSPETCYVHGVPA